MRDPEKGPSVGQQLGRAVAGRAGHQQGWYLCALSSGCSPLPAQDTNFLDEKGEGGLVV